MGIILIILPIPHIDRISRMKQKKKQTDTYENS